MRAGHRGEQGLFRGCCFGIVILLVLLGLLAFTIDRAVAAPELGAAPAGPDDGATQQAIAATLARQLAGQLLASVGSPHKGHAAVTLSEHDLTVIAVANNPHPDRFHNVQARVRNGLVLVSADTSFGPLTVTLVAHVSLTLVRTTSPPQVTAHVMAVDVGALHIPGWLQDRFAGTFTPSITLDQLFSNIANAKPVLKAVQSNLDCVAVVPTGVTFAAHVPGLQPDSGLCAPGAA